MRVLICLLMLAGSACHLFNSEGAACRDFTHCPEGHVCCDGECRVGGCLTPCSEDGACPGGDACHPARRLCVPALEYGCDEAGLPCPDTTRAGDACAEERSYIPCSSEVDDCSLGCRDCTDGQWSECAGCDLDTETTCGGCTPDHNCTLTIQNAEPVCAAVAGGFECDYQGSCKSGFSDNDQRRDNGCETACVLTNGGFERCDGIDNDCDGSVDNMAAATVDVDCRAQTDQATVATWSCEAGACAITTCSGDAHDLNGVVLDGCEYVCAQSGVETCNGIDDDCNGITDDVANAHLECSGRYAAAENVETFACSGGACVIAACVPSFINTDGQAGTGCEVSCTSPAAELCDSVDNDCNGLVDDGDDLADCVDYFRDADRDGDGDANDSRCLCAPADDYTAADSTDCDDDDPRRSGLLAEVCDGVDNDCDESVDNTLLDCQCTSDQQPLVDEICFDGIDDDCNQAVDDGCSCPPDQPFCAPGGAALTVCDSAGNLPVPGSETACSFLCSQAACADASNVAAADVAACGAGAPELELPADGTLTYAATGLECDPHCGDGTTNAIPPLPKSTVTTEGGRTAPVFCVSRLVLPSGSTLSAAGASEALILIVAGDAEIEGDIVLDGGAGPDGPGFSLPGGTPGPGGWAGAGGCGENFCAGPRGGGPGAGLGGARGAEGSSGGGGGAGFGGDGGAGGNGVGPGPGGTGGIEYGTQSLTPLAGGSGGGAGGDGGGSDGSGPGGGGGGALQISVRGTLTVNGTISARGGAGGSPGDTSTHGPGGGGSGGGVLLEARTLSIAGSIAVTGGRGGSNTGSGVGGAGATTTLNGNPGSDGTSLGGGGGGGAAGRVRLHSASGTLCTPELVPAPACTADPL